MTVAADPPITIYILCSCGREIPAAKAPIVDVQCPDCRRLWQWDESVERRRQKQKGEI